MVCVTLYVPDEGYFRNGCVRTKFDIYIFEFEI